MYWGGKEWKVWVIILIASLAFVCTSCSKGNPMEPASDNQDSGSLDNMFRGIYWTETTNDEAVEDTEVTEHCADITNVVYGHSYDERGEIKRADEPDGNEYTYTVVAWEERDGADTHIYFKVLYRDGTTPESDDHMGAVITVDDIENYLKKWPSITAHINDDEQIVVDIVYQRRHVPDPNPYNWRIYWVRAEQDDPDDFDDFTVGTPTDINPTGVTYYHVMNPDIVFDAGAEDEENGVNRLHVVAEILWDYDDRDIWYARGVSDGLGGIDWTEDPNLNEDLVGVNSQPRIDVGFDDTDYIGNLNLDYSLDDGYYVGVVWHHGEYDDPPEDGWMYDVYLTLVPAKGNLPSDFYSEQLTEATLYFFNVMPYIDIEPIENTDSGNKRTAMIVWTNTFNSGSGWMMGNLYATNTFRLALHAAPQQIFTSVVRANGLCTFAALADTSNFGYLTWLNYDSNDWDILAGGVTWSTSGPNYDITSANDCEISYGLGDIGEYEEYNYAPQIAVFDVDAAKAIWTDVDNGYEPSIWGDTSDWSD